MCLFTIKQDKMKFNMRKLVSIGLVLLIIIFIETVTYAQNNVDNDQEGDTNSASGPWYVPDCCLYSNISPNNDILCDVAIGFNNQMGQDIYVDLMFLYTKKKNKCFRKLSDIKSFSEKLQIEKDKSGWIFLRWEDGCQEIIIKNLEVFQKGNGDLLQAKHEFKSEKSLRLLELKTCYNTTNINDPDKNCLTYCYLTNIEPIR